MNNVERFIGYIERLGFDRLLLHAEEIGRLVGGLRAAVQRQREQSKKVSVNNCVAKAIQAGKSL
jgi:hypothetical protein